MLVLESEMTLEGLAGEAVTDFMLNPTDDRYRAWWPGTHLEFHVLRPGSASSHVGDVVLMDEYVGRRHLRMAAEVVDAVPGGRIVWRMRRWGAPLPIRVVIDLRPQGDDLLLRHRLCVGWTGAGRLLDPLWRLYVTSSFARELDTHARTEFPLLRDRLVR